MSLKQLWPQWNEATGNLSWGVQKVFRDAFTLVAEEQVTLVYGADYKDGSPCLVNSVAAMLTTGGGNGVPSAHFYPVVSLFDRINRELQERGVNTTPGKVSPLAADMFLRYFAPEQEKPVAKQVNEAMANEAFAHAVHTEPNDEDMARDWLNALQVESAMECDFANLDEEVKALHGDTERS